MGINSIFMLCVANILSKSLQLITKRGEEEKKGPIIVQYVWNSLEMKW